MRYVVTGGLGFVGSHVVDALLAAFPDCEVLVIDKGTYAASTRNLAGARSTGRVELAMADVSDYDAMSHLIRAGDVVVHAAAESHVDNSFRSSFQFTQTNAMGTHVLLQVAMDKGVERFLHVSTDEVYGENLTDTPFPEETYFMPTNPYSASKAAAEMYVKAYSRFAGFKINVVRSNNIYGPRQYPEKILPRSVMSILGGGKAFLQGSGEHRRSYLYVGDFCAALVSVLTAGVDRCTYNVASRNELTNRAFLEKIVAMMGRDFVGSVEVGEDRKFNDLRYYIDCGRIEGLGWAEVKGFDEGLSETIEWYRENGPGYWLTAEKPSGS